MKSLRKTAGFLASTAILAIADTKEMFAQNITLDNSIDKANSTLTNSGSKIANLVTLLGVLVAIVLLIWNFIQRAKGDPNSADKLLNFVYAIGAFLLIMTVLRAIVGW